MKAAQAIYERVVASPSRKAQGRKGTAKGRATGGGRTMQARADRNRNRKQDARIQRLQKQATINPPKRPDPPNPKPKP